MKGAITDKLTHALALADKGFRVFPLRPNSKIPPKGMRWKQTATRDESRIAAWWRENPDFNIGVATGDGTLVVDVDVKNGAPGLESLEYLEVVADLPDSYRVDTPSGGVHVYLKTDHPHGQRIGNVPELPGIDIKCEGNYVVGPGSVIDGKPYHERSAGGLEPMPVWLENHLRQAVPRPKARDAKALVELDLPEHVEAAKRWLIEFAPEAVEGAHGDVTTYKVACGVRDRGVSEETALLLLLDHWNEAKAIPPWDPEDLAAKVASAYRSAQNAPGSALPSAEFEAFPDFDAGDGPVAKKPANPLTVISATDFAGKPVPPREWEVTDWIPSRTVTLLSGDGGTGKSLLALQLAVAAATGGTWLGKHPKHGRALYLSAEDDTDELHRRLSDIAGATDISLRDLQGLKIVPLAGKDALLATQDDRAGKLRRTELFTSVETILADFKPRLLVLDTLADLYGGNENDRAQVRQFIGMLRGWALRHRLAVLLLSHPSQSGMASRTGTSGSTGWNNSVRSRLYLTRIVEDGGRERDPDARVLQSLKSNYGRVGSEIRCRYSAGVFTTRRPEVEEIDRTAEHERAERAFLDMLRKHRKTNRDVSAARSPNYAPAAFAKDGGHDFTKAELEAAMNRLFGKGAIEVEETGPPSRRRKRIVETGA